MHLETTTDTLSWYKTWHLSGSNLIRAKQKFHRKQKRACKSSWSPIGSLKSFTLTIPCNSANPVQTYPGIIVHQHLTVQKQMGLLRERYAGLRKEPLQYCSNQVWMKNDGRIPWSVTAICETYKISCLMGRHHMKGGSECPLKDQ